MGYSYVFGGRKDRLNVIALHSKQEHTLARGTSLAVDHIGLIIGHFTVLFLFATISI